MPTETFQVTGMTCEHCVNAVTQEVGSIATVTDVRIELVPVAASTVTVSSDEPIDMAVLEAAVDEAGYELAE